MSTAKQENIRLQYLVIFVGIALLVVKFVAFYLTNSNTIFSDALESIVNVVMAVVGLVSLFIAALPKDLNHPYGHGKVEFVYASLEGFLIGVAGMSIIIKSVYNFFHPVVLHQLDIGIALVAVTGLVNYILARVLERQGQQKRSVTLISGAQHLKSDAVTTLGLVIGLSMVWLFDVKWLDNLIAIAFGFWIVWMGLKLIRQSLSGIMDETDEAMLEDLVALMEQNRHPNWIDVHNLRIIRFGSDIHLDLHLTLPHYFTVKEAHDEVDRFEELMQTQLDEHTECFIHVDPCIESSCRLCEKSDCPVRQNPKEAHIVWTKELVRRNKKHGLVEE